MIPIAKPFFGKGEIKAVKNVIASGWVAQGPKVKQFEDMFASCVGSKYACAVSSCTTALHIALKSVGVKPGDVVITVSHSFIATANSIRHCAAEPVFIDIDPDTFNMSPADLERCLIEDCEIRNGQLFYKKISELPFKKSPLRYLSTARNVGRIAAIMTVHQTGMPCDLGAILSLARKFKLPVIEDAACAVGSEISMKGGKTWDKIGKPHGDIACFSFHPRKVITTGEGGILTTKNPDYDKKFRLLRHHGMSISDVARHNSKKVVFEEYLETAYNYRMSDIQAAVGVEQLKKLSKIIKKRRDLAKTYEKELKAITWLKPPSEPHYCRANWQSYPVKVLPDAPLSRDRLLGYLLNNGISAKPGIMNAHQEKPYSKARYDLSKSEEMRSKVMLLPLYVQLEKKEIRKIISLIKRK